MTGGVIGMGNEALMMGFVMVGFVMVGFVAHYCVDKIGHSDSLRAVIEIRLASWRVGNPDVVLNAYDRLKSLLDYAEPREIRWGFRRIIVFLGSQSDALGIALINSIASFAI